MQVTDHLQEYMETCPDLVAILKIEKSLKTYNFAWSACFLCFFGIEEQSWVLDRQTPKLDIS